MATYVLVHGGWLGGWCWQKVVPLLEAEGHRVVALDLPGHGDDNTAVSGMTLDANVACIREAIEAADERVILVGHSMGGIAITQAAEEVPDRIATLVYLSALLPQDGQSLPERAGRVPRVYIECLRDRVLPIDGQRAMQQAVGCERILTIDTDHSPFLSRPRELADHLLSLAQ